MMAKRTSPWWNGSPVPGRTNSFWAHTFRTLAFGAVPFLAATWFTSNAIADDWTRFRGENGSGIASHAKNLPEKWSETENLSWKRELPGPGSSCPIVVGDKVFVTCWSGYGTEATEGSTDQSKLLRHLVCINRTNGEVLWDRSVPAVLPEDRYGGMFAEHGYASHTPVSDGKHVYAFWGKSGVYAFDMNGAEIWHRTVGDGLDPRNWGSACSPILHKNLVIVLASAESNALYGLDKETGNEVWKTPADNFSGSWSTPILVPTKEQGMELVVGIPGEVWGFNPDSGKFLWYCPLADDNSYCSSVVSNQEVIYAIEGRGGGSIAIRSGGKEDVSKSHVLWKGSDRNRIGTPLLKDNRLLYINSRIVTCLNAEDGKELYKGRLPAGQDAPAASTPGRDANATGERRGENGGGGGRGRGGRGGGGMGGQDYGSPIAADGKIFYVTRNGEMHVLKEGDTFEHLATNRVTHESEDFSSTPAISDGQIFVRSSKALYCIEKKK